MILFFFYKAACCILTLSKKAQSYWLSGSSSENIQTLQAQKNLINNICRNCYFIVCFGVNITNWPVTPKGKSNDVLGKGCRINDNAENPGCRPAITNWNTLENGFTAYEHWDICLKKYLRSCKSYKNNTFWEICLFWHPSLYQWFDFPHDKPLKTSALVCSAHINFMVPLQSI